MAQAVLLNQLHQLFFYRLLTNYRFELHGGKDNLLGIFFTQRCKERKGAKDHSLRLKVVCLRLCVELVQILRHFIAHGLYFVVDYRDEFAILVQ